MYVYIYICTHTYIHMYIHHAASYNGLGADHVVAPLILLDRLVALRTLLRVGPERGRSALWLATILYSNNII